MYQAVAVTATPQLDDAFRQLSTAANYSRLWLGIAAVIATLGGRRGRRVALEGVLAIGATSATVNLGIKPLAHRRRPERPDPAPFEARLVPGSSFPSGHPRRPLRSPTVGGTIRAGADPVVSAVALSESNCTPGLWSRAHRRAERRHGGGRRDRAYHPPGGRPPARPST